MAEDLIKIKDFPIIDSYENVNDEDRVVATHVSGSSRQTVAITIAAIGQKIINDSPNSVAISRNYFGYDTPIASDGKNGDLYFKLMGDIPEQVITSTYVKINGEWVSFEVTDDNWRKFLEGQGFDVITYDARSIKAYAFDGNTLINNVIAPNVEAVYEYAFRGSSVKSLSLPKCTYIGEYAFKDCEYYRNGTHIDLPSIETIGEQAFNGFGNTDHRATINISNVKEIGNRAFYFPYFWNNIETGAIDLPNCETIGDESFSAYGSSFPHIVIQKINLPSIKTIGNQAFRCIEAPNNFEMHIGPNCTSIGSNILYMPDITNHKGNIYVEAVTPPTLADGFSTSVGSPDWYPEHIYVPYQSVNAYKEASKWSMYASIIEAIPEEE